MEPEGAARVAEPPEQHARLAGGRYSLGRRLGSGGMADVYLARDHRLERPVALKLLSERYAADPAFVSRLRREAHAAAKLSHPNVVAVHDWGGDAGRHFIVLEYVPGPTLKDVLRRGPMPELQALIVAGQVLDGLEAAHEQGIVHCDIKPLNILFDARDRVKVTDFGIASAAWDGGQGRPSPGRVAAIGLEGEEPVLGSAGYLAPEQIQGAPVDARADLYSLGATLYEMLVGRPPFADGTVAEILRAHVQAEPQPPRELRDGVSAAVETIVLRALAKDPDERFQSAADMREAVEQARAALLRGSTGEARAETAAAAAEVHPPRVDRWNTVEPVAGPAVWLRRTRFADGVLATGFLLRRLRSLPGVALALLIGAGFLLLLPLVRPASPDLTSEAATPARASLDVGSMARAGLAALAPASDCEFVLGFKQLRDQIPDVVGDCLHDERPDRETGQTTQRTTRGVLVWRSSDRVTTFTDGRRTWVDGPNGLQVRRPDERFDWEAPD